MTKLQYTCCWGASPLMLFWEQHCEALANNLFSCFDMSMCCQVLYDKVKKEEKRSTTTTTYWNQNGKQTQSEEANSTNRNVANNYIGKKKENKTKNDASEFKAMVKKIRFHLSLKDIHRTCMSYSRVGRSSFSAWSKHGWAAKRIIFVTACIKSLKCNRFGR